MGTEGLRKQVRGLQASVRNGNYDRADDLVQETSIQWENCYRRY
jgi:DNA-directed RNA polymerase specialized sigma24 family protein